VSSIALIGKRLTMAIDLNRPVLVVEDYLEMRSTMRMCLEELEFTQVFEADSVKSAKTLLTLHEFALIIADWQMPQLTGVDFLRMVRASFVHREVPFVMVTAYASKELVQQAMELHVSGFLVKPFDLSSLAQAIAAAGESGKLE
jgi:two-component system chemotaxis response regulator CheY